MSLLQYFINQINTAINFLLAVLLGLLSTIVNAEQLSGQFNVTVNLQSSDAGSQTVPNSAFCNSNDTPGFFGAAFIVGCTTGAVGDISTKGAIGHISTKGAIGYISTIGAVGDISTKGAVRDISPSRNRIIWSPVNGDAYRYIFQVRRDGYILGTIDSYVNVGSETSWRVINLIDRNYLEMSVNW